MLMLVYSYAYLHSEEDEELKYIQFCIIKYLVPLEPRKFHMCNQFIIFLNEMLSIYDEEKCEGVKCVRNCDIKTNQVITSKK